MASFVLAIATSNSLRSGGIGAYPNGNEWREDSTRAF